MYRFITIIFFICFYGMVWPQSPKIHKSKRTYEVSINEKGDTTYLLTLRENFSRGGKKIVESFFEGGKESGKILYFYENKNLSKSYTYGSGNDSVPYRIDSMIRKQENNILFTNNYYFEKKPGFSSGLMNDQTIEETDSSGNVILKVNIIDKWEYDKVNCEFFEYDSLKRITKKVTVYHCEDMRWNFESDMNENEKSGKYIKNYFEDKRVKNSNDKIEFFYDMYGRLIRKKTKTLDLNFTNSEDGKTVIERGNKGYEVYYLYNENNNLIEQFELRPKETKKYNWKKYDYMYF